MKKLILKNILVLSLSFSSLFGADALDGLETINKIAQEVANALKQVEDSIEKKEVLVKNKREEKENKRREVQEKISDQDLQMKLKRKNREVKFFIEDQNKNDIEKAISRSGIESLFAGSLYMLNNQAYAEIVSDKEEPIKTITIGDYLSIYKVENINIESKHIILSVKLNNLKHYLEMSSLRLVALHNYKQIKKSQIKKIEILKRERKIAEIKKEIKKATIETKKLKNKKEIKKPKKIIAKAKILKEEKKIKKVIAQIKKTKKREPKETIVEEENEVIFEKYYFDKGEILVYSYEEDVDNIKFLEDGKIVSGGLIKGKYVTITKQYSSNSDKKYGRINNKNLFVDMASVSKENF